MNSNQTVFVVDDDAGMRKSLKLLLESADHKVELFDSATKFLENYDPSISGCLILDIKMPEMSGIELQQHLIKNDIRIPIIIISAHADVSSAVQAMKLGSFDFMEKPYTPDILLSRTNQALERDRLLREEQTQFSNIRLRIMSLSPRERDVLSLLVAGSASKSIADKLSLSVSTVDNYRSSIMRKLGVETSAELIRVALMAGLTQLNLLK